MSPAIDPFDELAAIFLTDPDGRPADDDPAATTMIELLVVGHLPVRAGLWLTPCADAVARQAGPSILLRLDAEEATLQLLRGHVDAARALSRATLPRAIEQLAGSAGRWLVRAPVETPPETIVSAGADRITILSSADDAAVVAAYQIIKGLVAAAAESEIPLPSFGLAIVGSDEDSARHVLQRLNRATSSFVGVELQLVLCLPRMDAGVASTCHLRFADETVPAVGEVVQWIAAARSATLLELGAADEPEPEPEPVASIAPEPAIPPRAPTPIADADVSPAPVPAPPIPDAEETEVAAAPPLVEAIRAGHEAPPRSVKLPPKTDRHLETKAPSPVQEPDENGRPVPLARYVDGLEPMAARCPGHERVELAIDTGRRLHLLGPEDALRDMRVVERWARQHREILAMACPQQPFDAAAPAVLHIFASEPIRVADLHGSDVFLHVLAPVRVDGRTGWYAAPLNDPDRP
ncbi:MAG: hypothetical protein ACYTGG_01320 [Planctomycetota bacterium]|jgi:hypothetical protein